MRKRRVATVYALGCVLGIGALGVGLCPGCAEQTSRLSARGLESPEFRYSVLYKDAQRRRFVSSGWIIDNFFAHPTRGWVRKKGQAYYGHRVRVRERQKGLEKEKVYFFDLKLNHRKTDGVIWVQTFEIPRKHGCKNLDVLLANYADSLTGTGLYADGNIYGLRQVKAKKHAAVVKSRRRVLLDKIPALRARLQLADVDRLRVDPKHRGRGIELVVLRMWRRREVTTQYAGYSRVERGLFPFIMVIGYQNSARYFHDHLAEFVSFLRQFRFRVKRGPGTPCPNAIGTDLEPALTQPALPPRKKLRAPAPR